MKIILLSEQESNYQRLKLATKILISLIGPCYQLLILYKSSQRRPLYESLAALD